MLQSFRGLGLDATRAFPELSQEQLDFVLAHLGASRPECFDVIQSFGRTRGKPDGTLGTAGPGDNCAVGCQNPPSWHARWVTEPLHECFCTRVLLVSTFRYTRCLLRTC